MANSPQARKRAKQSKKRGLRHASQRSTVRTVIKKTVKIFQMKDRESAQIAFQKAVRIFDKAAARHIIHPNKAARLKSRLSQKLKGLA